MLLKTQQKIHELRAMAPFGFWSAERIAQLVKQFRILRKLRFSSLCNDRRNIFEAVSKNKIFGIMEESSGRFIKLKPSLIEVAPGIRSSTGPARLKWFFLFSTAFYKQ